MELVRKYLDKEAYLPSKYDLPVTLSQSLIINPFIEQIIERNLALPRFRLLKLNWFGFNTNISESMPSKSENINLFWDHVLKNNRVPFENLLIDDQITSIFKAGSSFDQVLGTVSNRISLRFKENLAMKTLHDIFERIKHWNTIHLINMIGGNKGDGERVDALYGNKINKIFIEEDIIYFENKISHLLKGLKYFIDFITQTGIDLHLKILDVHVKNGSTGKYQHTQKELNSLNKIPEILTKFLEEKDAKFALKFHYDKFQ